MGEVEHGPDPAAPRGNREHVFRSAELAHATHDLHPERHRAVLLFQPHAKLAELLHDRVDRVGALAAQ